MTWQRAVQAWIAAGSQISPERVVWGDQVIPDTNLPVPRPSSADGPWISIRELGEGSGGADWLVTARKPRVVALTVSAVDAAANTLTVGAHGLRRGDGPLQLTTTGTAPGGLAVLTDYWVLPVDATRIRLAASFLDAIEDFAAIDLTSAGSGAIALVSTGDTVAAGSEITRTVEGTRTTNLSIQCYGGSTVDANGAAQRLKRTVAALSLPSIQTTLRAANVGVASTMLDPVGNVGAAYQIAGFEPRAVLAARCNVPIVDASETGTVIESTTAPATIT